MHKRRSIRLSGYNYSNSGEYYITICVKDRVCCLSVITDGQIALLPNGIIVDKWILNTLTRFPGIAINHVAIMPNHIHLIVEIKEPEEEITHASPLSVSITERRQMLLAKVLGYLKMNSSKEINQVQNKEGAFWQANYYERVVRDGAEYRNIVNYIAQNPIMWQNDSDNPINLL